MKTEASRLFTDEDAEATKEYSSERRRKNLQILFNNTTIIPFKWRGRFLCFYCAKDFTLYPEFRKHTKSHGLCSSQDYSLKTVKGSHMDIKLDISEIMCEVCNEPFTKLDEIVDHLIVKHDMEYDKTVDTSFSGYRLVDSKCTFCDKDFTYFGYLMSHLNLAHPQNNFICDDCGATFSKKRDLVAHFRESHKLGGYPCQHCTEVFDSHKKLQRHQNSYHFKKCFLCDFHFATHYLLRKHFRDDHADVKNNKCPHCSKQCHSSQGIKQHMKKCKMKVAVKTEVIPATENFVQPKKKQNIVQIRNNILSVLNMSTAVPFKFFGKFSCFYCSIKFADFDDLKDHTALEHPHCDINSKCIKKCKGERTTVKVDISSLSCKLCSQPMEKLDSLIDHIISKHRASYDTSINNCFEPFRIVKDNIVCMSCPRVFRYFATLLRHTNSEHSNNSRICDFCGRSFKSATNLNVHISYAHTGACECEICGVKYKNQWCLSRHKAKCHNAKDFKCPNCPELFPSQYHRQKHLIKVHDIGHKCSYCGRMFTRNSFMKDHIRRTHLKEKNVECSICSEKFFDNYLLRLHMVKHEGVRKFSCDVCCKSFLRRSNLASHMGMHKKYGHVAAL